MTRQECKMHGSALSELHNKLKFDLLPSPGGRNPRIGQHLGSFDVLCTGQAADFLYITINISDRSSSVYDVLSAYKQTKGQTRFHESFP